MQPRQVVTLFCCLLQHLILSYILLFSYFLYFLPSPCCCSSSSISPSSFLFTSSLSPLLFSCRLKCVCVCRGEMWARFAAACCLMEGWGYL
uniref:Uncharacterized protein n=1 Tax=Arundo donax TaxID=35708 RepID=A0A0A9DC70_ARUDO